MNEGTEPIIQAIIWFPNWAEWEILFKLLLAKQAKEIATPFLSQFNNRGFSDGVP